MKKFKNSFYKISGFTVLLFLGMLVISCNNKSSSEKEEEIVEMDSTEKSTINNTKEFV
ncbi:hypothetical protein [Aequorivita lipolytica]|uniref:hypothetical protein n=1 Tax=Aequorivita lipolytica TaxID=153267 RepID=UPI000DBBB462|nr:hypothetical protein [Aequorivita lipolytica]SRX53612.1 hypothetical protein AEQU2_02844 [Aequorivita lipolytica]